ncbi:MAG: glutathione S-transferase family protein [Rhodospirillaceae bacterium]|jgi:glutathione S-transferase|nr:glutathione S-transferase family protein [Rhodospirillaceae bacterium]MBT5809821.1 glutathione S-transferase family protein [Rhodospirillaceae bacterium]
MAKDDRILWGIVSSRALRAHWALIELDLEYRTEPIQSRTGETQTDSYTTLNPRQKIPVLQDGDLTMSESAAIVAYLAERYARPGRRLMPEAIADRARYFEWQSFICMELDATSLYVLRRHEYLPEVYGDAPAAVAGAKAYFTRMIGAAADAFDDGRPFLLGDDFSGVDILMSTVLDWARRYGLDAPDPFLAYQDRLAARPGYAAARLANQSP